MAASFFPARLFSKTGRFGSRHQKKKSNEPPETNSDLDRKPSIASGWRAAPADSKIDVDKESLAGNYQDNRRKNKAEEMMGETVGLSSQFQGLPPSLKIDSQSFMEDDELMALGITTRGGSSPRRNRSPGKLYMNVATMEEEKLDDVFEMEVPIQIVRDRRPDLQVSIPQAKMPLSKSPRLMNSAVTAPTPQSAFSTGSILKTSRLPKSGTTATPISIVSPLSALEMPKPQRPFSTESIEGMAKESKSPNPENSTKIIASGRVQQYGRNLIADSRRFSSASVDSDSEILIQQATEVVPAKFVDATAFRVDTTPLYHAALVTTPTKKVRIEPVNQSTPTLPHSFMRRQASSTSLATTSTINVNKPLPPEPGRSGPSPLKHIAYSSSPAWQRSDSRGPSRSNSTSTQRKKSVSKDKVEATSPTSVKTTNVSRKNSRTSLSNVSLRSKYTPKDLDAMDNAFQRKPSVPNQPSPQVIYSNQSTPSQSQVSLAMDPKHLTTINESSPRASDANLARTEAIRQVSRGPMRMEPTRRPPQPPQPVQRVHTIAVEKVGRRRPVVPRTASSNQLPTQTKKEEIPQRSSTTTEHMSKAERVLGKKGIPLAARPELPPSLEFRWDSTESPGDYVTTESPAPESESEVPELDALHDAQEMEIRKRLALLSAKDDPSTVFETYHQRNDSPAGKSNAKTVEETREKPSIEEKLHLTGSVRNEINVPTHIAELEAATRTPSPAELEGSFLSPPQKEPAELGLPSPQVIPVIPIPPEPEDTPHRRGRFATSNPLSSASGKSRSLHSQRSVKVRSLASLAASDIPDIYASLPSNADSSGRPSMSGEEVDELITADAAEHVLLHILKSLDNLEDLFAASMVSKGFYRTFKRHELFLLKHAIWRMSPAAWELREMSIPYSELPPGAADYTANLYFRHYVQDLLTMVELKAMILESCKSFLRPETYSALAGETQRSPMIDEAFWRVWSFCRIFGCGNNREDDIVGQMDWLKGGVLARQSPDTRTLALTDELARNSVLFNPPAGFAKGNGKGLTPEELYDIYEIWTCLGVLVRGYQGKRQEAREYGVYDGCDVAKGDVVRENQILEEWTHHLLTLSPSTVLDVTSPATPTRTQFAHARSQGYTSWMPPKQEASSSTFLKEAVSRVYEDMSTVKRPSLQSSPKSFSNLPQAASPSIGAEAAIASRARIARHAEEIRRKKQDPNFKDVPVSDDRPLSNYSDVLDRLEAISAATDDAPPMPKLPGLAARLSRHKSKGHSIEEDVKPKHESPERSSTPLTTSSPITVQPAVSLIAALPDTTPKTRTGFKAMPKPCTNDPKPVETLKPAVPKITPQNSPSRQGAGRFSSLRGHITPKRLDKKHSERKKEIASPTSTTQSSEEKFPVYPNATPNGVVPTGPQVRDPVDLAVERLVEMGFEEDRAKKALAATESGNGINFESAFQRLNKEKERRRRLERLETMG